MDVSLTLLPMADPCSPSHCCHVNVDYIDRTLRGILFFPGDLQHWCRRYILWIYFLFLLLQNELRFLPLYLVHFSLDYHSSGVHTMINLFLEEKSYFMSTFFCEVENVSMTKVICFFVFFFYDAKIHEEMSCKLMINTSERWMSLGFNYLFKSKMFDMYISPKVALHSPPDYHSPHTHR